MKLVLCRECTDIFRLFHREPVRQCLCGKTKGFLYEDGMHAKVSGPCVAIGFANSSFAKAVVGRPERGLGKIFDAFVIPKECPTVEIVENAHEHLTKS